MAVAIAIPLVISLAVILLLERAPFTARVAGSEITVTSEERLRDAVDDIAVRAASMPVTIIAGEQTAHTTAAALGLAVDVDATVARTVAWRQDASTSLRRAFGQVQPIDTAVTVAVAEDEITRLAGELSTPAEDAAFVVGETGLPTVRPEVPGQDVTPDQVLATVVGPVQQSIGRKGLSPVTVDTMPTPVAPDVLAADLDPLLTVAQFLVDGTVTIVAADGTHLSLLQGADVLDWVRVRKEEGPALHLEVAQVRVPAPVQNSLRAADQPAIDAQILVDQVALSGPDRDRPEDPQRFGGTVRIEPGQTGMEVDPGATWQAVLDGVGPGDDLITVAGQVDEPEVTADRAASLGVTQPISSFTTFYSAGQSRVTNIHRIAEIVDGATILPGESFELNHFVGERTRARGFASGGAISAGEFITAVGGGVSQFATTFFNAAWFSGIELVDFKPHSYYISRYPVGREATIDFPTVNLKVRNDTPYAIVVRTSVTGSSVTVTFWSTPHWTVQTDAGSRRRNGSGFRITVTRTRTAPGGVPESTPYTTDYRLQ